MNFSLYFDVYEQVGMPWTVRLEGGPRRVSTFFTFAIYNVNSNLHILPNI